MAFESKLNMNFKKSPNSIYCIQTCSKNSMTGSVLVVSNSKIFLKQYNSRACLICTTWLSYGWKSLTSREEEEEEEEDTSLRNKVQVEYFFPQKHWHVNKKVGSDLNQNCSADDVWNSLITIFEWLLNHRDRCSMKRVSVVSGPTRSVPWNRDLH